MYKGKITRIVKGKTIRTVKNKQLNEIEKIKLRDANSQMEEWYKNVQGLGLWSLGIMAFIILCGVTFSYWG